MAFLWPQCNPERICAPTGMVTACVCVGRVRSSFSSRYSSRRSSRWPCLYVRSRDFVHVKPVVERETPGCPFIISAETTTTNEIGDGERTITTTTYTEEWIVECRMHFILSPNECCCWRCIPNFTSLLRTFSIYFLFYNILPGFYILCPVSFCTRRNVWMFCWPWLNACNGEASAHQPRCLPPFSSSRFYSAAALL